MVSVFSASACLTDLGGADITGKNGSTTSGVKHEARCGLKLKKCDASFKDQRLIVDEGQGIL
jgi:hypothetical protein